MHAPGVDRTPVDEQLLVGFEPGVERFDPGVAARLELVLAGVHRRPPLAHGVDDVPPRALAPS